MNRDMEDTNSQANDICMKIYKTGGETLVAACDAELLGKTLVEGEIEFHVSEEFYNGIRGGEEMLKKHLSIATIANLVGERSVGCGIKMGLIDKENILNIDGIPHAQFALL